MSLWTRTHPFKSKLYFSLGDIVSNAPGLLRVPQRDGKALQLAAKRDTRTRATAVEKGRLTRSGEASSVELQSHSSCSGE